MNHQSPGGTNPRTTWLIIFAALTFSILLYGVMCFFLEQSSQRQVSPSLPSLRPIFVLLGVGALVASLTWLRFTIDGKIGGEGRPASLSPGEFQSQSIIALALAEACSIFGLVLFFLGAPIQEFAYFAAGTLFIDFAFILPRGLQFWSTQK